MSEVYSVSDVPISADPVIAEQQIRVRARAERHIQDLRATMPRSRLVGSVHLALARFRKGRIYEAEKAISNEQAAAKNSARQIEETVSAKRLQVPVLTAFFDVPAPETGSTSQLGPDEERAAKALLGRISLVEKQGYGIGYTRPLPLFDSRRPLQDSVEGGSSRVAVAVLGELGLGLSPGDFVELDGSVGGNTVMEAVTAPKPGVSDGHPTNHGLRIRYEQQGPDASLSLTVNTNP